MRHGRRFALVLCAAGALAGCMHSRPLPALRGQVDGRKMSIRLKPADLREIAASAATSSRAESLAGCLAQRSRATLTELAISGGGSQGAWAAGFLRGWTERGDRPEFDIVTGVSTGAILGVFAFLGPEYDSTLERSYTEVRKRDVMRERPSMLVPLYTSVASSQPLRERLERLVSPQVLARIAEEGARGRRLYIGTVDLDLGMFHTWDLTTLAAPRTPESNRRCIDVLMASTAVGVFYPPVFIEGSMHVDGGTRRHIFAVLPGPSASPASSESGDSGPGPRVYALVNARPQIRPRYVPNSIVDIGTRSVEVMADEALFGCLLRIERDAAAAGMAFRLASIPTNVCEPPEAASILEFDPKLLRCLYDQGAADGRAGTWAATTPDR